HTGEYAKGYEDGNQWTIGESDARITSGWFWGNSKKTPKSMEQLGEMYFRSVGHNSPLLLNIPPNNQGTVDTDILNRLAEFGSAIKNTFDENLAANATISVDSVYGNDIAFKPSNMLDENDLTYWATAEGTNTAEMIIDLGATKSFDIVSIEEAIQKGQRIKSFKVEVSNNGGEWKTVDEGATIGAKRLSRFKEVKADKVRITMATTDSEILISEVGVYKATRDFEMPNPIPDGMLVVDNTDKDTSDGAGFSYNGWTQETGAQYVNETNMYANPGAEATLTFNGTNAYLIGTFDPNHGTMEVFIDGVSQGIVDTSATTRSVGQVIYATPDLTPGQHTLRLVVKNRAIGIEAAAILANDGKGMLEIEHAAYRMPEESELDVKIKRTGGSTGAVSVILQDNPGSAVQGDYYTTEGIVVEFADGETEKTVTIRTKRDSKVKGDIFFTIELVEPTNGAIVGFNSEAVITIEDLDGFSKEQLQELYDSVSGYIEGTYNEGWEAFATAKAFAQTTLANEDALNYGKAYLQLKAAKDALVPLGSFTEANPYVFPAEVGTTNTLEAEYAALENTGAADETWKLSVSTAAWASNGKFVNCLNQNDIMRIPYKAATAGTYEVTVTYRSGDPNNKLSFTDTAGNIVAQDVIAGSSDASTTKTATFTLVIENAGTGVWTFTGPSSKSPQIDKFDIKLVSATVSTNALEAAIAKAEALTAHLYTEESYAALSTKVEAAKALIADENKTQASVNAAVTEIENAINALVGKPLDDAYLINKSANSGVTIEAVDSQYTGETADKTLDYNNSTHWHSDWSGSDRLPISITYDLGQSYDLANIAYLPRQDGSWNGDIFEFDLYVGDDANNLTFVKHVVMDTTGSVADEKLANRNAFQRVMFEASGRYVKMTVTRSGSDNAAKQNMFTSMAEIRFYEKADAPVVPEVNKDALVAAIDAAKAVDATAWTEESYQVLADALASAETVAANEAATQEEVDAA
ncbi:MAG: discoidin domain-containing protein, partial [Longicatena sp.]|nr:discoidin domain-containing protein [Longicatena sp.]